MIYISIVSPVYCAEHLIQDLIYHLVKVLEEITNNYEIILVEDRSPDESWHAIQKVCASNEKIIGIRLSRNFGQHYAISAGLSKAKGEWIVVMDCDLQDQPSEIHNLLKEIKKGYDIVLASRAFRQDNLMRRLSSKMFYKLLGYLTETKQDPSIANFGIYNKKVIKAIKKLNEKNLYFPTLIQWVGFNVSTIAVSHSKRPQGKSSYNLKKLTKLAFDIILANSDKPMRLTVKTGFLVSLVGFIYAIYTVVQALHGQVDVQGYSSIFVTMLLMSGLIISSIGVVGLYVGKTFEGIKNRPHFIVDEVINDR